MWVVLAHFICLFLLTYCPPDSNTVSPPIKRHCCSETGTWAEGWSRGLEVGGSGVRVRKEGFYRLSGPGGWKETLP